LTERGLELSHEKTSITRSEGGFDFLGQNVRRYEGKVLLKPSRKNVQAFLAKIPEELRQHGGSLRAGDLIQRRNPKIRGWALYHRHAASKRTFAHVDNRIVGQLWRWARRRHRNKSAAWVKAKYFTQRGHREWVFRGTVPDDDGSPQVVTRYRASATRRERHVKVQGKANP
jgi:RNA-directed DNA polymerase